MVFDGLTGSGALEFVLSSRLGLLFPDGRVWDAGMEGRTNPSSVEDIKVLFIELDVVGRSCVTVALLWLDPGLEEGSFEVSRLRLLGRESRTAVFMTLPIPIPPRLSWLLPLLATELPRLRPGGDCTLHLLFTLSDRFIMALCTKPPMPLVGDGDLSSLSGDIRPCEGDIASERASGPLPPGGSSFCTEDIDNGEVSPLASSPELLDPVNPPLEGVDERSVGSSQACSPCESPRDMPGICIRLEVDP